MKLFFFTVFGLIFQAESQCTWPAELVSSTWVDNYHGDLVFGTTTMSGWSFSITTGGSGQFINDWQCVISDQFDTDGFLVMRSVSDFTLFVTSQYYAYVCLKMKKVTDFSYRYYIFEPEQPNINYERYLVSQNGDLSSTSLICYESYGASGSEYRVIVKSGNEAQARVTCPWVFLGRFDYFHTENGVNSCTAGNNNLDVCADKEVVAFDFTQCNTDVAYSGQTSVSCIDNVPVGTDTFVTVYNSAVVDGINTFRFSCFGVSRDLSTISVAPEYCRKSQTTNTAPTDGALVTLTSIEELCRTCAVLSDPDGGNVTIRTDGADTVAYYTCASQYDMYGDSTRTCQSNETWTGTAPVCKCKFPNVPANGNVTVSSDGLLATYTCNPGYVLTGNQHRTCQANGNAWNGTDPTCDTCATIFNISNGLTVLAYEGITSIASFTCEVNYTLSGPRTVVCQTDGTWNDTTPTCVTCDAIVIPNLGTVTMTTDGFQTTASYSCDVGYQISGIDSVTCQTDGSWNGSSPSCTCETLLPPTSGSVNLSTDGMTATYTCNLGYTLSGESTRGCLLNGTSWTNSPPTCELCSNLTFFTGGAINYTTDGLTTVALYTCLSGYTLNGAQTLTCSSTGSWSSASSTCVLCQTLSNPSVGNVTLSTNGTVSIATYSCYNGYDLHGDITRMCQTDGTWTNMEPSCTCSTPNNPTNGNINITGDVVQYTCDVGYSLDGDSLRYCLYDGTGWNGTSPSCSLCDNLTTLSGGNYTVQSIDGLYTLAIFACSAGYTMDGAANLVCQSDGTWNAVSPNCTQCNLLNSPANGSVSFTSDGQVTIATFTCDLGTSLSSSSAVTTQCNTDGTWTTTGVTCVSCDPLTNPDSGNLTVTTNGSTTTALYTCSHGYYLLGDWSRSCLEDGTWTSMNPNCVCEVPNSITNGQVTISNDGMLAVYTCDAGYSMAGQSNLTCQTNGAGWDAVSPICSKCSDLTGPLNGNVTVSTNGTNSLATYLCDVGYTISGTSQRTCDSIGNWTAISPSCVQCDSLTSPDAGSFTLFYNGTNTLASFTCDSNYYIQSGYPSTLTCRVDGSWASFEPICVCELPNAPTNGNVMVSVDGLTANYTCDVNYSLNGTGSRVCDLDGTSWNGLQPVCVSCSPLPNIQRGNISYTSNGQTTVAQYSCNVGSTLSGVNTRYCGSDGSWIDTVPSCVECPSLGSLSSGVVSLTTDGYTTTAVFYCSTGYYLEGETLLQCLTSGQWSNTEPSCICDPPTAPYNGSVVLSNNNQTATYTCELGYILSGNSVRTCGSDGSGWSGTQPECVTCEAVTPPTNGTVNVTTDGKVTQAVFACLSGSTLFGNPVLTCTLNGTWDDTPPTCATCPSLTAPSSGGVSVSTNGTLSVGEFTCTTGYSIVGNSFISCQTDATWNGSIPDCVCEPPSVPVNGTIVTSTNGMTVVYSCDVGTTLSGPGIRYCQTDGTGWTDTDPLCASCPDITTPTHGTNSLTTNGTVTIATFNCSSGYSLSGSVVTTCQSNGFWDTVNPDCVMCTSLSTPDSGSVTIDSDGISSMAQFTCVAGYQINGNDLLSCLSNGSWSLNPPTCVCTPPSSPVNGNVTLSPDMLTVFYSCKAGYTLQGQITRTCQTGGVGWTDSQPSCSQCEALSNPLGGSITMTTSGTVTQATFICTTGYTLNGGDTLACRDDGTWDISAPTCTSCSTLSSPNNGMVILSSDGSTTVANVSCSVGYTLSGTPLLTCRADGSWDFTTPLCAACLSLPTVLAGTVTLQTDGVTTTAETSCVTGYYVSGEITITCQSDGSWNNNLPSCVCEAPSSPMNGSFVLSNGGMTVTYTCNVGFTMVGDDVSVCGENGTDWSSPTPTCVYCVGLNSSNNVTASSASNGTTTIVTYTCGVDFTLSGSQTLSCLDSGIWSSGEPTCVECPSLSQPSNGTLTINTNGTATSALFTCDIGHTLSGSDSIVCQSDGTWSDLLPTCSECETLIAVSSGNYTLSTDSLVTIATFSCVTGYYIDGSSQLTCRNDGTWDNPQPSCVCSPPANPMNGGVWLSSDGMTAIFSCNQGYSVQGETSNTCNTDGTGWLYSHPTCTECQPLIPPNNGNITQYTNGTFTKAQFSCDDGYTLSSDVDISVCRETGVWNLSTVACVKCEILTAPGSGSVSIMSQGSNSMATYSCVTGYDLQGVTQRSCLINGSWDHSASICVCQQPSIPTNGNLVISVDQQTVTYICNVGYSLSGVVSRLCATDGTGWTDTDPLCVPCATLTAVSGGNVTLTTNGQTTTANYSCDPGNSMSGNKLLTCRSDGTWDFNSPSCVSCDPLAISIFGSQTISTDGTTSSVSFTCNHGYTLTGSQQAVCSSTGSWSNTEPDCVECANLTNPNSGTVNTSSNGTVTVARYTCTSGYSLIGQDTLTCQSDGSWDSIQPTCVCDPPNAPQDGNVTMLDSGYTAIFSCLSGYTLNGDGVVTCPQNGAGWNGSTPFCVQCSTLSPPTNGTLTTYTDGITTVVVVGCDVGYTASGSVNVTCQLDGTYDIVTPSCVKCADLQALSNGTQQFSSLGSEAMVTFTCDLGFSISGQSTSACLNDGSWTESVPICVQCATFPTISSSTHVLTTNGTFTSSTVTCLSGYSLTGISTVSCAADGSWSQTPSCVCDSPGNPISGNVTADGHVAVFTCNLGYSLNGSQISYCNTDGSGWNSSVPVCVPCSATMPISVGQADSFSDGANTYILYTCPIGYTLLGNQTITCEDTGSWSSVEPTCTQCATLNAPDSGNITMTTDNSTSSVLYTCNSGYYLEGVDTRLCQDDGTWTDTEPICYCISPGSPLHGNVEVSVNKTMAVYTCGVGYTISGESSRVCQSGGAGWSGLQPSCTLCLTLPTPTGGLISTSTDGTVTMATFTCGSGYTLVGSQSLMCRSDGSWNTSTPTCVVCDPLTYPTGGSYTVTTDGLRSVVQYSCGSGYTLNGNNDIECSTTGQWIGQAPSCVSCVTLTTPDSGTMTLVSDNFTTTAIFSCNHGYYLSHMSNLTCDSNGQWDNTEPECLCDPPSNISHGNYMLSGNKSELTYSCDTGYTLNGSVYRTCQDGGQGWTGNDPSCVQCTSLVAPSEGSMVSSSNGSTTLMTVSCDSGSTLSGNGILECGPDGTWSATLPTCVQCPIPTIPTNGNYTMTSNGTLTTVEFVCDVGYTMSGISTAVCETTASWSTGTPTCVLCTSLDNITNGDISIATNGTMTFSAFNCIAGYYLKGDNLLECRIDGSWSNTSPSCACDPPLSILNGNYTISTNGMVIYYTCDLGYTISGSPSRSCGQDGTGWSGSPPTCTTCDSLSTISNGNIALISNGTYTIALFECDVGYSVDTAEYAGTCNTDGTWNMTVPACVQCPTLPSILNGNSTLTSSGPESVMTYSCLPDYILVGDTVRVCQQGIWNGSDPQCLCTYTSYLQNGKVVSDGITILYTCNTGYTLSGPPNRTCQGDGTGWSLTEPNCVLCDGLTTPNAGSMNLSSDGSMTTAYFTCQIGYTLTGSSQLTCRTDGTWNTVEPSCGVACSSLSMPQGGSVTMVTDGLTTTALYTCNTGYSLFGAGKLSCRSDGSWDLAESTCVQCETITAPNNGNISISSNGTFSLATYTCDPDYYIEGANISTCQTDGKWNNPQPTCYCIPPSALANGTVSLSMDRSLATFTCTEGFTLQGSSTVLCQNDYSGWSDTIPICVYCGIVTSVQNGTTVVSTDGAVTSVVHTCNSGTTLSGSPNISCSSNGTWEDAFPTCVTCDSLQTLGNGTTTLGTDGIQTYAQLTCDMGYSLFGEKLTFCSTSGSWNTSVPLCVRCDEISAPSSGSKFESTDGQTTRATFSCVTGYHIEGHSNIICLTDGSWNGTTPLCVCDIPISPTNGQVFIGSNTSIVHYTCDTGFTLDGDSQRLCSDQGTGWIGTDPLCVQCDGLSLSSNLSSTLSTNGTRSVVVFDCDLGFSIDGPYQLECLMDGSWSGSLPSCVCEVPTSPTNGDVISDGVTALYTCDIGYSLYGDVTRVCQQGGQGWNGSQPTCTSCNSLNSVSGGSVVMTTDGTTTVVEYTCGAGYTMFGASTLSCRSDGTWDFTNTSCVTCDTLMVPDNGNLNITSNGEISTAYHTCNTGYTLKGTSLLTCRTDGTWDFAAPQCVKCSDLSNPSSGSVSLSSDGQESMAAYSCLPGYYLAGDSTRVCGADAVWNGTEPSCVCDPPVTPSNSNITYNDGNMTVQFTCDVGYTLSGSPALACQTNGNGWNSSSPTCSKCDNFTEVSNSSVQFEIDGDRTVAIVTCDTGTTLVGQSHIECQANGTWNIVSTLDCVDCPALVNPTGGKVSTSSNGSVTTADFTCDTNYSISGGHHLECLNTGQWDTSIPSCVLCVTLNAPLSGSVDLSSDSQTTTASHSCNSDYEVLGHDVLICQDDGTWNSSQPVCVCKAPTTPTNGNMSLSANRLHVTFSCNVGYSLNGEDTSYCDTNGSGWNTTVPTCVSCSNLNTISNGNVTLVTNQTSTYATYTCEVGYTLNGDVIRTCLDDGSWTSVEPSCILCPTLFDPLSGRVTIATDGHHSSAGYVCATGYQLNGTSTRTCQTDGQWNGTEPSCLCLLPTPPANGYVMFGSSVSLAVYTCVIGYSLNGTSERRCQTDGSGWDNVTPNCVICETLLSLPGSSAVLNTDGLQTTAFFTCDTGYTLIGETNLTCRSDGTWNLQQPTCATCESLAIPDAGAITLSSNNSVTEAFFTCMPGYSLQGSSVLTCRSTGTWDFTEPNCVSCPSLISPSSGDVNVSTNGQVSTAVYTCVNGYYLEGVKTLICLTTGVWDELVPSCKCNPPNAVANGNFTISDNGTVLTHVCDPGYSINGDASQICDSNGNGWLGSPPICSKCIDLQNFTNGILNLTTDGAVTIATYSCSLGYSLDGYTVLTCLADGSWDYTEPNCEICVNVTSPPNSNIQYLTDGTVSYAQYMCDTGYSLNGEMFSYCLPNGTWNSTQPTCVDCHSVDVPDNGHVAFTSNGTITIATVTCNHGYSVVGEVTITCFSTGQWSHTTPYCLCDDFTNPVNGNLVTTDNGTVAMYTCEPGYTLNGDATVKCGTVSANYLPPSCTTCDSLPSSAGLSINITTDNTTTSAIVSCNTGYTIAGDSELTCRSDGTWDISLPTCVSCAPLIQPDHSTINMTTKSSVTIATITCDSGSSLSGSMTLTCRADGTWDYVVPTCVQCPVPTAPSAGNVTMTTNGLVSMVAYACTAGYYTNDSSTSVCLIQGNWSSEAPICVCIPPPNPDNGSYSLTDGGFTVVYNCDSGYSLLGSMTLTCDKNGNGWNDSPPSCTKCQDISPSTNSSISFTSNGTTTYAEFQCDTGYTLSGSVSLSCDENGAWSGSVPSCEHCPVLTPPVNGSYILQTNGTVTSVIYQCVEGSSLFGSSESQCSSDGTWTSTEPSCVDCPLADVTDNGHVAVTSNGTITIATVTCNHGYSVIGEITITCLSTGKWSSTTPNCLCDDFTNPVNGNLVTTDNGTVALYTCEPGYTLNGDATVECGTVSANYTPPSCTTCDSLPSSAGLSINITTDNTTTSAIVSCNTGYTIAGDNELTCRSDGTWDISLPTCVSCDPLSQPDYSIINMTTLNSVTIATITCDSGSSLSGSTTLTCRADGTWDYIVPTCVKCSIPTTPQAGNVTMTTDGLVSMVTYTCADGYYTNGSTTSVCLTQGNWSSDVPICVCTPPPSPDNGSYSLTDGGFTAVFSCNSGHSLLGSVTLTCDPNGNGWNDSPPTCSKCIDISPSTNSSISVLSNGTTTYAEFKCDTGYTLSGSASLSCDENGAWSGSVPLCEKCSIVNAPSNGSFTLQSNGTATSVIYQCGDGSSLLGSSESQCSTNGTWTSTEPNCVTCPDLGSLHNGAVQLSSNGSVTIATFLCISGYSVLGESEISCLTSGQWSHNPPTCFCDDFTQLLNGNINLLDNGTKASYSCDTGYSLNGDSDITCGSASSSYTTPTCSSCDSLTLPTGASVSLTSDNTTTYASFECDTGYTIVGDKLLTCRSDGTWDISTPTCASCKTLTYTVGAYINITSLDSVTVAHITCLVGYTMAGTNTLTCRSDGSWDFQLPTCVKCEMLSTLSAGNVTMTTDGLVSSALFSCSDGYYAEGVTMITCNITGQWSSVVPTCKCDPPSKLANGSYVISTDSFTVTYSCNLGYTMTGSDIRTCDTGGNGWSGEEPVCVACEEIVTDSSVTLSLNGTTSTAGFTCEAGYNIVGLFSLVCNEDGTWSGNFPTCQQCTSLNAPDNGSITIQSNGTVSSVSFTCSVGSTLYGESQAVCNETGVWSFEDPLCVPCASLSNPLNGAFTMDTDGTVTMATFMCDSGYILTGDETLTCNSNGTWNSSPPVCNCGIFEGLPNGNMNVSDDGTKAVYTCASGYTLYGVTELYCTVNTSTNVQPTCVTCITLPTIPGASVTMTTDGIMTVASVSCNVGYTLSGDNVLACKADGTWNVTIPNCVVCDSLSPSSGVNLTLTSDNEVTRAKFTCPYGFTLNGSAVLECRTDGSWNLNIPTCECDPPVSISNGALTLSSDGMTATYSCNLGYSLRGLSSRTCSTDGSWWSGMDPNCTECYTTSLSQGLNRTLYTDGISTTAFYQCDNGYTISHRRNLTCLQNGTWDDLGPICVPCPQLNVSNGLSYDLTSDGWTTTASFTCSEGYSMTGPLSVSCFDNGTWDKTLPSCDVNVVSATTDCDNQNNGAAIGLGVLFAIAAILAIIFAVIAWRYRKLYKGLGGSKASYYSAETQNWILQDTDRFTPSKAPVGHQHHVMDKRGMSRASSKAPLAFAKHSFDADITHTPSPALMTSKKLGAARMPRSSTTPSASFMTESTAMSLFKSTNFDMDPRSSPLPQQIASPRKDDDKSNQFSDIPTLRLEDTSTFTPYVDNRKSTNLSFLSEQRVSTLSPSSILVAQEVSRGDSPLPQQILTPRNDEDIKIEQTRKKHRTKKASSHSREPNSFTDKRSGSTLYNDTIASKMKKRGKDFIDSGTKGLEVPPHKRSRTPSPSFIDATTTDLENDISDVEV